MCVCDERRNQALPNDDQEWIQKFRAAIREPKSSRAQRAREFCKLAALRCITVLRKLIYGDLRPEHKVNSEAPASKGPPRNSNEDAA
jgi:hypothetical protein